MELSGSRIIVAGATGAVGGAVARELAGRGAEVGLLGRDRVALDAIADDLGGAPTAAFDALDLASCRSAIDAVAAALGALDGLVVAIGAVAFGDAADVGDDITRTLMAVNATAPIALLRAADAHLEAGGALVAVTAIVAEHPTAGMAAYSASKAALSAYLTALRRERRRARVQVLDARLPHLDTAFAEHALAGTPPALPGGFPVTEAARVVVDAVAQDRREIAWDLQARELQVR